MTKYFMFFDLSEHSSAWSILGTDGFYIHGIVKSTPMMAGMSISDGAMLQNFYNGIVKVLGDTVFSDPRYDIPGEPIGSRRRNVMFGVEDIFSQSVTGYNKLSKLQGFLEYLVYREFNSVVQIIPVSTIRKKYNLNIDRILTEDEFIKAKKARRKKNGYDFQEKDYNNYLLNPKLYYNRFPDIYFGDFKRYREIDGKFYSIDDRNDLEFLTKILKNGSVKIRGTKIDEYKYAVKMVVVYYINKRLNTKFTFKENDTCDSTLGGLFLLDQFGG